MPVPANVLLTPVLVRSQWWFSCLVLGLEVVGFGHDTSRRSTPKYRTNGCLGGGMRLTNRAKKRSALIPSTDAWTSRHGVRLDPRVLDAVRYTTVVRHTQVLRYESRRPCL